MPQGQPAARLHKTRRPRRQCNGDPRGHQRPAAARRQGDRDRRPKVCTGITFAGIDGDRQVRIEADQGDMQHAGHAIACTAAYPRPMLVWMDLEMTGLDPDNDRIIEIATLVTDANLRVLAEGPVMAVSQPQARLDGMDEWNTRQHNGSGLVKRVQASAIDEAAAEQATLDFLATYVPKGRSPMCGNSICQDRRFLARYMPALEAFFHYRHIDVSTLKELARRWAPEVASGFSKTSSHLAMDDIRDSIEELSYYRHTMLKV